MKTLQAGDLAPQFTLLNQDNQPISLSDFKGKKVLVYFYPKALTQAVQLKPAVYVMLKVS